MDIQEREKAIVGCILGTAVGDALGLSCEGMAPLRRRKMFGDVKGYHFLWGRGMVSDDTEHTCMVAQSLLRSGGEHIAFARSMAWRLRWWSLAIPAGVGLATLRSIAKLWVGFPPQHSGVFSAGNGPAMRSALLGIYGSSLYQIRQLVRACTRISHSDPKAELATLAVAVAARFAARGKTDAVEYMSYWQEFVAEVAGDLDSSEFNDLLDELVASVGTGETTAAFVADMGLAKGISGYIYHTVPAALHAWLRHPRDYRKAIAEIIECGGDTDTTAAIVGAIVGAGVGKEGIPQEWLDHLWEWPRTVAWMEDLGKKLAHSEVGTPQKPPSLPIFGILLRNLLFLMVVLLHGFRRLLPPY